MHEWITPLSFIHAACTWFMAGLIWFVQVVHYPLMARVGANEWVDYERAHVRRTTLVVAPVMLIEAASAILLVMIGTARPLAWSGALLLALIWMVTFVVLVPAHARLEQEPDQAALRRLVRWNWPRTAGWTLRAAVASVILFTVGG
ncbi:MAG: hypothetical protein KF724_08390 [Phycisphaeraceae bacterium]|nr:hypothetical protein [Phycisphaeraceae bacterium]